MKIERYVEWVLVRRTQALGICALITLLAIAILSQATFATSVLELFFGDSPAYLRYQAGISKFGESERCVIAFEDKNLFTTAGWNRVERISNALMEVEEIAHVQSLATQQNIRHSNGTIIIENYKNAWNEKTPNSVPSLEDALSDPMIADFVVSKQGPSTIIVIEFEPNSITTSEIMSTVYGKIMTPFLDENLQTSEIFSAGLLPESVETTRQTKMTLHSLFPLTVALLLLMVYLLFGQFWPVLITGTVALLSMMWTFAFAVVLDPRINLMMAIVPAVMTIVAFADVVHLCSAYSTEFRSSGCKQKSIRKSATAVGEACLYTSITTLLGFAALSFAPTPALKHLGIVLGLGVAIALGLAVTLTPIILDMLPEPRSQQKRNNLGSNLIGTIVAQCRNLSASHPRTILLIAALLTIVSCIGIATTHLEASLTSRLRPSNHIRKSHDFVSKRFAGSYFLDFYIHANDGSSLLSHDNYSAIAALTTTIENQPNTGKTISIIDLFAPLQSTLDPSNKEPPSQASLSEYLLLLEMSGEVSSDKFIDSDHQNTRILVPGSQPGLVTLAAFGDEILKKAQSILPPSLTIEVTGLSYLLGKWVDDLLVGNLQGILFALLTTAVVMSAGLGLGIRNGIIAMIPNVLPIIITMGFLGWGFDHFDPEAMLIGMIAIGIAVDDTIHFLTRLKQEWNPHSKEKSLDQTFTSAGEAIVKTTIILCAGFLPFAASDYLTTRLLGTLLPITILTALLADLLVLPALVNTGLLSFGVAPKTIEKQAYSTKTQIQDF